MLCSMHLIPTGHGARIVSGSPAACRVYHAMIAQHMRDRQLDPYYAVHACRYGVMGLGAVVHTLNPRLFAADLEYIINHGAWRIGYISHALQQQALPSQLLGCRQGCCMHACMQSLASAQRYMTIDDVA